MRVAQHAADLRARLVDDLRRADLYCLIRTVQTRQQVVRAAIAGEVDAVVVGEQFDSDEFRDINEGRLNIISPRDINTNKHVREFRLQ